MVTYDLLDTKMRSFCLTPPGNYWLGYGVEDVEVRPLLPEDKDSMKWSFSMTAWLPFPGNRRGP